MKRFYSTSNTNNCYINISTISGEARGVISLEKLKVNYDRD